jgi:hypothetical protein
MAVDPMNTTDISRFLLAKFQRYYHPNWESHPKEYAMWNTMKGSDTLIGYYDTIGNLAAAAVMTDGADFDIGAIVQAYETSIESVQYGKGFGITLKAMKAAQNKSDVITASKVYALSKAMLVALEALGIKPWDDAFTVNLADGVPMCSNSHPCKDTVGGTNETYDNLTTGSFYGSGGYDNLLAGLELFATMKDHQGKPVPSVPDTFKTHAFNQYQTKAVFESTLVPFEATQTNTKNILPGLKPVFSNYLTSKTAWWVEDTSPDRPHGIFQYLNSCPVPENHVDRDIDNGGYVATTAFFAGASAVPNVGIVGSTG